jgi:archaeal flagellar protein FlaI
MTPPPSSSTLEPLTDEQLEARQEAYLSTNGIPWADYKDPDPAWFPRTLQEAIEHNPHLAAHLDAWAEQGEEPPIYLTEVPYTIAKENFPSLIYPIAPGLFIHIQDDPHYRRRYHAIQPRLTDADEEALRITKLVIFRRARYYATPDNPAELAERIKDIFAKYVHEGDEIQLPSVRDDDTEPTQGAASIRQLMEELRPRIQLPRALRATILYRLLRDLVGAGPLEPVMRDPYLEDIHSIGVDHGFVIHKLFGMIPTNIRFRDELHVDDYVDNLAQRIGRPVSEAVPIVDATLNDGSRINIIYSDTISRRGPSFSIRRVTQEPVPVTRLIQYGTVTPLMAAYLWLCLENGMSLFFCGDAACGKTTTLNAVLSFVDARSKIYTAEDTPEVTPPHPVWQRLLTRETGPAEGRVAMFDLLKAALRSRPNYIVVGEIRGAEGAVAFQAMQTGHPCVASFHAETVQKMIQRLTSDPINVPLTFIDNLNVAVIQKAIHRDGRLLRRITDIAEIEGYSEIDGGVLTRPVFSYDAIQDKHAFRGRNNSYILEKKIAETLGYPDPRMIYDDLDERARVLEAMVENEIFHHEEVNRILDLYKEKGILGLPFTL